MAFHPYPGVVRELFNAHRFGPPEGVTRPSACPRVDHSVSRLPPATPRHVLARFRSGSAPPMALSLAADGNSWDHYAKGTPSRHSGRSDRLQAHDFRVCFTPLLEVLFTFPSRYWFAFGLPVVFSLAGWSPRIQTGFLVSRPTQERPRVAPELRLRASHPLRGGFPAPSAVPRVLAVGRPTTPARA